MKIKYMVVLVALAVLTLPLTDYSSDQNQGQSQPCPASGKGTRCMEHFKTMDANHDGSVSLEEFKTIPHHRGYPEVIADRVQHHRTREVLRPLPADIPL